MPLKWVPSRKGPSAGVLEPLSPRIKWRAILFATLLLVPAFWAILGGFVSATTDEAGGPNPAAAVAFGLALIPFVFIVLAFMSEHPRAPGAVLRAMVLCVLIGLPALALAADAVTGLVAGIGAGGVVALRQEPTHSTKARWIAIAVASLYAFIVVRLGGTAALLTGPVLPFTVIGVADHLVERRRLKQDGHAGAHRVSTIDE